MSEKSGKSSIAIAIIIAGLIIAGAFFYTNKTNKEEVETPTTEFLSGQEAAEKAINYINQNKDIFTGGMTVSLVNVTEENGVYKFRLKVEEDEYDSYVTKDGKILFISAINLEEETSAEVPKSDKPDVKLFVMSYCPYGLQAQKMFLPVYNLLKDKAEMGVYFVDYIMHEKEEIDENLRQYCIQKEEKEKYYNYLNCFAKDGSYENFEVYKDCLKTAGVDEGKMNSCISQTDQEYKITELYNDEGTWLNGRFPKFDVHKDLNDKYGVRGSPTIVINDSIIVQNQQDCPEGGIECTVIPDFGRFPEKFKEVICQAFNTPPAECSQTLSEETFSPGFGLGTGSSSEGSCE